MYNLRQHATTNLLGVVYVFFVVLCKLHDIKSLQEFDVPTRNEAHHGIGTLNPRKKMEAGAAKNGASTSAKEEISREEERRPSLNSLALMRKATAPAGISSVDIKYWRDVVYEGVLLENNTQAKSHFPLNSIYLSMFSFCSAVDIDIPKLKQSSYLFIQGRFNTSALSPNTTYEVAFVVKHDGTCEDWGSPVNVELDLPNEPEWPESPEQPSMQYLKNEPSGAWIKLRAGEFMMGPDTVGRIIFTLYGTFTSRKSGLILRGVLIHPKEDWIMQKHNQFDDVEPEFL
ncbi:hypothetical protein NL676_006596 [Syzygium grande]|nr:hypothetical protein NL676_006596 [Syzygium grande]